jgi:ABC-2 type transport system ATP-binding protein
MEAVAQKHGAAVHSVQHPTTNLEDLFLKTVRESIERPGQRYIPTEATAQK